MKLNDIIETNRYKYGCVNEQNEICPLKEVCYGIGPGDPDGCMWICLDFDSEKLELELDEFLSVERHNMLHAELEVDNMAKEEKNRIEIDKRYEYTQYLIDSDVDIHKFKVHAEYLNKKENIYRMMIVISNSIKFADNIMYNKVINDDNVSIPDLNINKELKDILIEIREIAIERKQLLIKIEEAERQIKNKVKFMDFIDVKKGLGE